MYLKQNCIIYYSNFILNICDNSWILSIHQSCLDILSIVWSSASKILCLPIPKPLVNVRPSSCKTFPIWDQYCPIKARLSAGCTPHLTPSSWNGQPLENLPNYTLQLAITRSLLQYQWQTQACYFIPTCVNVSPYMRSCLSCLYFF